MEHKNSQNIKKIVYIVIVIYSFFFYYPLIVGTPL